jgi:iron complex transport system permease protein
MKEAGSSRNGRFWLTLLMVVALILVALTVSTTIGAVSVSAPDIAKILVNKISGGNVFEATWESKTENIIWNIRFPRVIMAFIVGAGLSLCGVLMQALTKNPLADPYVLGISSGASAGAVGVIILGWFSFMGGYSVIFGATLGAAVSICLSLGIASMKGRITSTQLVLAGIATSAFFSAVTNLIIYGFNQGSDKTKMAQYWMVGSLSGATWSTVKYVAVVAAVTVVVISLFAKELDVLLLGDDVAETLGMDTRRTKLLIIVAATVLTGVVVSVSGVIGFVGLVVPHIMRSLVGSGHRRLIPVSILAGGLFTMVADLVSRVIIAPEELPIGVIAAFIGAPFFLYLIRKGNSNK